MKSFLEGVLSPEVIGHLKELKHRAWLAEKAVQSIPLRTRVAIKDRAFSAASKVRPYQYSPERYRRSFVHWDGVPTSADKNVPRRVFVFWTGENKIPAVRRDSLEALTEQMDFDGIEVILITPESLHKWVVRSSPLHPAYEHLSLVHRSDYLRAYFMFHHGGGYSDLKRPTDSWKPLFERMDTDSEIWLTGYPEFSSLWVAQLPRDMGRDLQMYYKQVPGGGAYIARAHSQFALEWLSEVERRLSYYLPLLSQHPGGIRGEDPMYPVSWNRLLAQVVQPLSLKHQRHISVSNSLRPDITNYR